jgi:transcription termination factor NusB
MYGKTDNQIGRLRIQLHFKTITLMARNMLQFSVFYKIIFRPVPDVVCVKKAGAYNKRGKIKIS